MTIADVTGPASVVGGLVGVAMGVRIQHVMAQRAKEATEDTKAESATASSVALFNALNQALQTEIGNLRQLAAELHAEVDACEEKHAESLAVQKDLLAVQKDLLARLAALEHPAA